MKRILLTAFYLLPICLAAGQVPALTDIYSFTGTPDGGTPDTPLVRGANGTLFGTADVGGTYNGGVAFELTPPSAAGQPWTESVIYSFVDEPGGYNPEGLTPGEGGILYGTAESGGNDGNGVVFSLTPPVIGGEPWTESILFTFPAGSPITYPATSLVLGPDGSLYGGANAIDGSSHGYFYKLSPPTEGSNAWVFSVLHDFADRDICTFEGNGLTPGPNGVFYYTGRDLGPNVQAGGVGELVPSADGNSYTDSVLYTPRSGAVTSGSVVLSQDGRLYGTTLFGGVNNNGSVFEVIPPTEPGGSWTSKVINQFTAPGGAEPSGLLMTPKGDLIGVTRYGSSFYTAGAIFLLEPPSVEGGDWTESILHEFAYRGASMSAGPVGPFVAGPGEAFYGLTASGGANGIGSVFELVR